MDMKNNRSPTKEDFLKIRENTGMNRKELGTESEMLVLLMEKYLHFLLFHKRKVE